MNTNTPIQKPARSAGILLHPTSLPGPFGIGDLGPAAYAWVDALVRARQTWWQVLPLTPTGFGDSPYQSFSAFAGNVYLISPELLVRDNLAKDTDLQGVRFPTDHVDYGNVIKYKMHLLKHAWLRFQQGKAPQLKPLFEWFCAEQGHWLDDYTLFMALKEKHGGASWLSLPKELVMREPAALKRAAEELKPAIGTQQFRQFLFYRQWEALKNYANDKGIQLIGDIPIFVSSDSVDVWANPDLFLLDKDRKPKVVAGVPPDYFSQTGQLWGNPHYDWEALKQTGYAWWVARLKATLIQVDMIRLDHFRGFEAAWTVDADEPTAEKGEWVKGPGEDLFKALQAALGGLPLIAEDLGLITPDVEALRDNLKLPGMRILHFAFGNGPDNRFLPHHYERNTLVYTGTHDNDTTRGWFATLAEHENQFLRRYQPAIGRDISWELIRMAWSSVADYAVVPLQDVLNLGTEARMNLPGRPSGNWSWRFTKEMLTDGVLDRLADLTELYSRSRK